MDIITSHNTLDFDGLASMVAAGKLYPAAIKVFSGTLSNNVKRFLALYKDSLVIRGPKEIDYNQVERMIVVDTASASRLGQLQVLTRNSNMDYHIYDHHPAMDDDLKGSVYEVVQLGAATTILVEKIIENNLGVSPFEATILALGIYEDTGSLLFSSTTARDAYAAAFLLGRGANLPVIANFMEKPFSDEQRHILQSLLDTAKLFRIQNLDIVIAISDGNDFIQGLDLVCHRLFEMENCDAVFVVARMEGKINAVGRSRTNSLRINEVLQPMGGRGHDKAASAVVKNKTCEEVSSQILENIEQMVHPVAVARDIMSTPVKSIPKEMSMEEAGRLMLRYGHTGMPVVEGEKMVGVISRRDVGKARIHNLGHAPVKGFMTSSVLSVAPDTAISEVQRLMVENDIGRLPVTDQGRLMGIISRTDILRILHGEECPEDHQVLYAFGEGHSGNVSILMQRRLPRELLLILELAGEIAQELDYSVYCLGGFVRDLLLQVMDFDVDLVVEGDGRELARRLAEKTGGKVRIHERFKTAVVVLVDGTKIDVATARTEYYEFPAALPSVEKSSIREDMYRRDFTINTLAICLNPERFGDLMDYFGGRKDLQNGDIRILYNLSFVEDPTRILRAIRFEQRYKFTIEPDTLRFARDAIERRMLGKLSYKRIMHELILILSEKDPGSALQRMKETGVWQYILPEVKLEELSWTTIKRIPLVIGWWEERDYGRKTRSWLVYILLIFAKLSPDQVKEVSGRYSLDREAQRCIEDSLMIPTLASLIAAESDLLPSEINQMAGTLANENLIYLLLCMKNENDWERIVRYLDLKEKVKLQINGHDLLKLGIKAGPYYKTILDELYNLKINQIINSREEEIKMVEKWVEEGRFSDAMAN